MSPLGVGERYAYRESRYRYGEPVSPVEVVKLDPKVKGGVRVVHLDGDYAGLQEWVPKQRLLVPWSEAAEFCDDERRALVASNISICTDRTVLSKAVGCVFSGAYKICRNGEAFIEWSGIYGGLLCITHFDEVVDPLALDREKLLDEPGAFVDRHGQYVAPFSSSVRLAQYLCERFPTKIGLAAHRGEEDLCRKMAEADRDHMVEHFEKELALQRQSNELIRQWCPEGAWNEIDERIALRDEIQRLRKLVEAAIQALEIKRLRADADELRKQLGGSSDHASRRRARGDGDE